MKNFLLVFIALALFGAGSAFLFFNNENPQPVLETAVTPKAVFAKAETDCLTISLPAKVQVGEKVRLALQSTSGFEIMNDQISWTILYSEAGKGKFSNGEYSGSGPQVELIADRAGVLPLAVTVVRTDEGAADSACGTKLVTQEFQINIQS